MDEMLMTTVANLKEENQRLKEQIRSFEFERDVKSIYSYSWSENDCIEKYDECGILRVMANTHDLDCKKLHELTLKYGYDYVDNYFKYKHEEWLKSIQEENEEQEGDDSND